VVKDQESSQLEVNVGRQGGAVVKMGEEAIGGGGGVVVKGQYVIRQAIDSSLSFGRGELDAEDVLQESRKKTGGSGDLFRKGPHALVKAHQSLRLGLDVLVSLDQVAVNSDSVFTGVGYCSGDKHEPVGQP